MKRLTDKAPITRREFVILTATSAAALATGCATNPVSGRKQFMLISEGREVSLDLQNSPHQISADYGALQDSALNKYIAGVGNKLAALSHRPNMPFSFRGVNAAYVNAYAFPGGTIGITRGMLAALDSEAELAAVLGHEIGHVCARHTASSMSKGLVLQSLIAGGAAVLSATEYADYTDVASAVGLLTTGVYLAYYSRDNEREADALSLGYMTKADYNPDGCIGVMNVLRKLSKDQPNVIELLFATHPMSDERYQTAVEAVQSTYASERANPEYRERYQEATASIRAIKGALTQMQNGEKALGQKRLTEASACFESALKQAPRDYAGLLMLAKCRLIQQQAQEAERYAGEAKAAYPSEAQAWHISGMARLQRRRYETAYVDFTRYEQLLPGNPNTNYFRGYCEEGLGRRPPAAEFYMQYLRQVSEGEYAQHAYRRLVEWGYIRPTQR